MLLTLCAVCFAWTHSAGLIAPRLIEEADTVQCQLVVAVDPPLTAQIIVILPEAELPTDQAGLIAAPGLLHQSAATMIIKLVGPMRTRDPAQTRIGKIPTKAGTIHEIRMILMIVGMRVVGATTWAMLKRDRLWICSWDSLACSKAEVLVAAAALQIWCVMLYVPEVLLEVVLAPAVAVAHIEDLARPIVDPDLHIVAAAREGADPHTGVPVEDRVGAVTAVLDIELCISNDATLGIST